MNKTQKTKLAVTLLALPLFALTLLRAPVPTTAAAQDFDAAAAFKAKCSFCHGPKAEKRFDASKSDEELLQTVMTSGKPGMPAFETKGITVEQAKAIIAYMKSLHQQ